MTTERKPSPTPESDSKSQPSKKASLYESTGEKRYQWPPVRDPNLSFESRTRNPVHAVVTALPLIMLAIGLFIYFYTESRQNQSAPLRAESIELSGTFTGMSETSGRHYLWVDIDGVAKGIRIQPHQLQLLESLVRGEAVQLQAAPRLSGSRTYWVLQVEQKERLYLEEQSE